jgi:hypothetical protein
VDRPFHYVDERDAKSAIWLLDHGATPKPGKNYVFIVGCPLAYSIEHEKDDDAIALIERGVSVKGHLLDPEEGCSGNLLEYAIRWGSSLRLIRALIEGGAETEESRWDPWTASVLDYAAYNNRADVVRYLVRERSHELSGRMCEDIDALYWALIAGSHTTALELIALGADVNRASGTFTGDEGYDDPDDEGDSQVSSDTEPRLVLAVRKRAPLVVLAALLDAGADINRKDMRGFSALAWAKFKRFPEIEAFLVGRGAAWTAAAAPDHIKDVPGYLSDIHDGTSFFYEEEADVNEGEAKEDGGANAPRTRGRR